MNPYASISIFGFVFRDFFYLLGLLARDFLASNIPDTLILGSYGNCKVEEMLVARGVSESCGGSVLTRLAVAICVGVR